jgi:hypothetical protein
MQRVDRRLNEINAHLDGHDRLSVDFAYEVADLKAVVAELNLQVTFVMNHMQFKRNVGHVADATGRIPTVTETLMERYMNGGREMLIAKMELAKNAQSQPADAGAGAGDDQAPPEEVNGEAAEATGGDPEEKPTPTPQQRTH